MKKINVVHLTSVHPALDNRIFHKECRSLSNAGYNINLIAPHSVSEKIGEIRIYPIQSTQRRLKRMTISTKSIYRIAMELQADLYHFHDIELIPVGLLLKMHGKRVIYDIHEDLPRALFTGSRDYMPVIFKKPASLLIELFENLSVPYFSALIAATPAIHARFKKLNRDTLIINNFPDLHEYATVEKTWKNRNPYLAYIGVISPSRGLREMVTAISMVSEKANARLKLAGNFSIPKNNNDVYNAPGWDRTDKLGFVNRREIQVLLSNVQAGLVLFHPEPNHIQAQPNKLFEYMSAGIPVIASDFPLWRQIVRDNRCGLLVDPLNPREIADAIEYVLAHPVEAEEMGIRGRDAVHKYFNWDMEKDKLLRLYADVLSR